MHLSAFKELREWWPAGVNGLTIRWVWARRRGKARRARATKAAAKVEKVEKVEFGQQLEITEATGCRPERN